MKITTIGLDLAKLVFQVHAIDEFGKAVVRKQLKRAQVAAFFANVPACLIGMEACGSAHYWARKLQGLGHSVKLMAPQFVKPYVKSNKNDAADAQAICEAVGRPNMRFVPIKDSDCNAASTVRMYGSHLFLLSRHVLRELGKPGASMYESRLSEPAREAMGHNGLAVRPGFGAA